MELIEQLICFGLTRQEATIYIALLSDEELTGYEVAKLTGISRSNSYNALAGLVEKGAAYIIEGTSTKYTPVPPEEFCENKLRSMKEIKNLLIKNVPSRKKESDGYITIRGKKHIYDKLKNMLEGTKQRVYISAKRSVLKELEPQLKQLMKKGIKLVIITGDEDYCLKDAVIYYNGKERSTIGVIVDTSKVLTGELTQDLQSTCLYSKNNNLIVVFREMLRNEIELIEIEKEKRKNL
jgi:HTH-type transcriptional regulator, sugar sensing transcriptional regulator